MDDVLVSDLGLTDEHETGGLDESISSAAEKLLDLGRGVLVVVGDGNKVKGIVTPGPSRDERTWEFPLSSPHVA